jgi:plastocyanin
VINVGASGSVFSPESLTVKAGTPVTFIWITGGHTVTSGANCTADGKFGNTAVLSAGQTLPVPANVINTPGTYPFFCTTHCGQNMKGTLTVTP